MTPSEFKAWFAVFSEAVDGTPTPRQWAKIQKRVDEMQHLPQAYFGLNQALISGN